jgi:hypothetical protein
VLNVDVTRVKRMPGVGDPLCGISLVASVANVWSTTIRLSVIFPDALRRFEVRRTLISTTATPHSIACPSLAGPLKAWPARTRRIPVHHAPAALGPVTHAPC